MDAKIGDAVQIHSYKHDHKIHRIWRKVYIIDQDEGALITGNKKTKVVESDGRSWMTREPAICYFSKKYWFNIIAMMKPEGIHYYCNLSSPYVFDGEAIKYIDYDLDVKVFADYSFIVLDRDEYQRHKEKMGYSEKLQLIIDDQLNNLLNMIRNNEAPFSPGVVESWYNKFLSLQGKK